jgi:BirA family biotin operon repressor/biotin-[acetyl-CoA-carboxylase] ligase
MKKIIIGNPLIHMQSVDSTNVHASRLLQSNEVNEGTVILADHQTMGKGQAGTCWISEAGSNLLFSLILRPNFLLAEQQFFLSMCVSNAIVGFLIPFHAAVKIKWPNDILMNRKKVAGILIENTVLQKKLHSSVVGIGLNVNQKEFPASIPDATSLSIITGRQYDLSESLGDLLNSLSLHLNKLYDQRFAEIKTLYLNNLQGLNEWAIYVDSTGTIEGRIVDVTDASELLLQQRNGHTKRYGFKEIEFKL